MVMPKILKMMLPPAAKAMSVIAQVHAPRRASNAPLLRRVAHRHRQERGDDPRIGSTMNRIDVKIRTSSIARSSSHGSEQPAMRMRRIFAVGGVQIAQLGAHAIVRSLRRSES